MTIYYTLTFGILVTEMFMFGILVLPLPSHWRRAMLKFVSTSPLVAKALYVLKIVFGFIFVLFIDTINRLQRIDSISEEEQRVSHDYSYEANMKAKKFYAQRNLYLTGFTLFLSLILERTSTLVIQMLKREEELENAKKENVSVGKDQQRLIDMEADYKKQIENLKKEVKELKQEQRDFDTLKKQVGQQAEEYNRLADERNALERAVNGQTNEPKKNI
ncbi:B-cell receptor-associated protein 31-like-domain-containing protein [Halteromyces radiatus]|uniref:B-cell receptor-associated protein 31-like-domain-containing protein n=1 Tax=Halteromyces radiatus TaxID=101107 RepID=UPI0022202BA9|nr:B-cell receptor-associated protein 31-like-domain-containing protein [Halteromyces radiatus]KAI8093220.1 B-cell receptor-associated protein 31-like-domain-containing protein [Halteromyces radiatus]